MDQYFYVSADPSYDRDAKNRNSRTAAKLGTPRFKPVVTREVWNLPSDSVSLESSVTMEKSGELILR